MTNITNKILLVFSVLVFVTFSGFAQQKKLTAQLNWGQEYTEPNNTVVSKIIGITPAGFYVLREKVIANLNAKPKVYLEYFNRNMKLVKSVEQELKYKGKRRDFEDIIMIGGQLYLLTSYNNEAKKKNFLFRQKISMRSLLPAQRLEMIAETEARNKEREGTFDFHISKDSSKMLIYNQLPYQKREPERFALRVYDNSFEEIWDKNIVMPYPDNQISVEEYRVDNDGNVYLLCVIYKDGAQYRRRGNPNYEYTILAYTNNGQDFEQYTVDIGDKFITDLTFRVANDGNLVCTGFYSEKGTYSVKGTYFFRLNSETKEMYNKNLKEFDFDFLTVAMNDREVARAKEAERSGNERRQAELYQYALDDLVLRSDGGALLVAEQYFVYERNDYDRWSPYYGGFGYYNRFSPYNNNIRRDLYYNYNDVIVVNIRPNGEIEWTARIPKRQETVNDGGYYSSYAMSIVRDRIYFVYNDNGRNYGGNLRNNRVYNFNGNQSVIVAAEVTKDGEVTRYPLLNNNEAGIITRPKICKQIGRKEMAIFGEGGRTFRFASLKFN